MRFPGSFSLSSLKLGWGAVLWAYVKPSGTSLVKKSCTKKCWFDWFDLISQNTRVKYGQAEWLSNGCLYSQSSARPCDLMTLWPCMVASNERLIRGKGQQPWLCWRSAGKRVWHGDRRFWHGGWIGLCALIWPSDSSEYLLGEAEVVHWSTHMISKSYLLCLFSISFSFATS